MNWLWKYVLQPYLKSSIEPMAQEKKTLPSGASTAALCIDCKVFIITLTMIYWCLKSTFNISVTREVFQGPHVLNQPRPVSHSYSSFTFIHTWPIQSDLHRWPLGQRGSEDAPLWELLREKTTLICLLALLFPCITSKAWNNSTTESADTCLQVTAPVEINEINTPAPVQSLCRTAVHEFILPHVFTVQNWLWSKSA